MSCEHLLNTQSFLDGELTGAEAAEAERHLQTCAECQAFAAEAAELSDALRQAPRHAAPAHLRAAVLARLDKEPVRFSPKSFWMGAAGGAGISALAAGFALLALLPPSIATLTQSIADAHVGALTSGKTIMVVSSNHHTVKPWLAAHAGLSPPVTDFASDGYKLTGGRVDEIAGRPAAVMVYAHGNHEVDLFAWPDRGAELPGTSVTHGFHIAFWKQSDMDFAAVSDMDPAAFQKFVALARAQRE
ncbi:MAG TPA: zf-HC2 domain-containing protein [Rhizomicrobium sp.]|jgi:anti-sigma factor RsiW|nr:zf-HC2 domain-containing protein [Rhizomicrobium sp.]